SKARRPARSRATTTRRKRVQQAYAYDSFFCSARLLIRRLAALTCVNVKSTALPPTDRQAASRTYRLLTGLSRSPNERHAECPPGTFRAIHRCLARPGTARARARIAPGRGRAAGGSNAVRAHLRSGRARRGVRRASKPVRAD